MVLGGPSLELMQCFQGMADIDQFLGLKHFAFMSPVGQFFNVVDCAEWWVVALFIEPPQVFGVDYGHAEVAAVFGSDPREYSVMTKEFMKDEDGNVKGLVTLDVEQSEGGGFQPIPG